MLLSVFVAFAGLASCRAGPGTSAGPAELVVYALQNGIVNPL